jgi:hypothetical protein
MDFSVEQKAIPALCMCCQLQYRSFIGIYIVFTPAFDKGGIRTEIKQYIENLGIQNFEIIEKKR